MSLGKLVVSLVAESAQFIQGMDKAAMAASKSSRQITASFGDLVNAQLAAEAAMNALSFAFERAMKSFDSVGVLFDAQAAFGTTAEKAYQMQRSVESLGDPVQPLINVMGKLQQQLAATGDESKGTGALLGALGLDLETLKATDPTEALLAVVQALQTIEDPATRARLAQSCSAKATATPPGRSRRLRKLAWSRRASLSSSSKQSTPWASVSPSSLQRPTPSACRSRQTLRRKLSA